MKFLNKAFILDCVSAFARFYMAYIWISAGISKLNQHATVAMTIRNYDIFTGEWSNLLAHIIGPLEIMGGVLLLLGLFLKQANKIAIIVLTLFVIGIAQAWLRGLNIDCGCFEADPTASDGPMNYAMTILRDFFYIFLSGWTIFRPFKKLAIYP